MIVDFVGRVVADPKINGYFLNSTVDGTRLTDCLVKQVANATGGPQAYDCRTMRASHQGLKISKQDFDDLVGHLVAALTAKSVTTADINIIAGVLTPMAADIVEDTTNNGTVYQRVGRKPAVVTVINTFVGKVAADTRINGFFTTTDIARLKTCLVRQVCSIDGPCKYGKEVDTAEPGVSSTNPCKTMMASHAGLMKTGGGAITITDFNSLVGDLVETLDGAGVTTADKTAILGVLGPMCPQIVAGGTGCPP